MAGRKKVKMKLRESGRPGWGRLVRMPRKESGRPSAKVPASTLSAPRMPQLQSGRPKAMLGQAMGPVSAVVQGLANAVTSQTQTTTRVLHGVCTAAPHEITAGPFGTLSAQFQSKGALGAMAAFPLVSSNTVNGTTTSYFETQILSIGQEGMAAVGLTTTDQAYIGNGTFRLSDELPEWQRDSFGWHSDDGGLYLAKSNEKVDKVAPFAQGAVVGVGICCENTGDLKNLVFLTLNGMLVWKNKLSMNGNPIQGLIGCDRSDTNFVVNTGQFPFMFSDFNRVSLL